MRLPLNRVIAFAGPYISVVAGAVATWLVAKANVAGIEGLDQANVATQLSAGLTFALVSVLTWLGQSKWLTGHHIEMVADAQVAAAALALPGAPPVEVPAEPDHEALMDLGEDLPDDEVEFASQPPGLPPIGRSGSDDADLPDDVEEFAAPPDQESRVVPDTPDLDEEPEDDDGDVRVAPGIAA